MIFIELVVRADIDVFPGLPCRLIQFSVELEFLFRPCGLVQGVFILMKIIHIISSSYENIQSFVPVVQFYI